MCYGALYQQFQYYPFMCYGALHQQFQYYPFMCYGALHQQFHYCSFMCYGALHQQFQYYPFMVYSMMLSIYVLLVHYISNLNTIPLCIRMVHYICNQFNVCVSGDSSKSSLPHSTGHLPSFSISQYVACD